MANYDLSIILPGIRSQNWTTIYEHTTGACTRYSFEFVIVGPYAPPANLHTKSNVKYIKDFGCISRCLQMGSLVCEGKFLTWFSDDAHIYNDSLNKALDLINQKDTYKDVVLMRYTEGPGHSGAEFAPSYWQPATHPNVHAAGVDFSWACTPVLMMNLEYFRFLGGLDCKYEHANMNALDLGFRAQKNGSKVHHSPTMIQNCDWVPGQTPENSPMLAAFLDNDRPLYKLHWSDHNRPISIPYDNWKDCPPVWPRKFRVEGNEIKSIRDYSGSSQEFKP